MDRQRANQLLPIIQAFAEGKQIQFTNTGAQEGEWFLSSIPNFNDSYKYRIKPEPLVLYVVVFDNENLSQELYQDERKAKEQSETYGACSRVVKMVEEV